ncbi:protein FMC1 homolog isoform X2 [Mesocricetus auratus]|uniref:Protein FMC1 homolog isoform X2 n=1 Tax=Mesocricetus auratus TaxID=10036 RepID=A0ABM2W9J5_MESAU|nr:protein FMC1 homolog isoform X2 [Mesocricetus auratus]XP_040584535.1 protein FMC1 homolog isoform X2 [Mesocricetus auratus]
MALAQQPEPETDRPPHKRPLTTSKPWRVAHGKRPGFSGKTLNRGENQSAEGREGQPSRRVWLCIPAGAFSRRRRPSPLRNHTSPVRSCAEPNMSFTSKLLPISASCGASGNT